MRMVSLRENSSVTAERAPWLSIVGINEDGLDGLCPAARRCITQASLVVGGRRHLALAADALRGETLAWPSPPQSAFPDIQARRGSAVCVLASGDPFFYGIGSLLARVVAPGEMICHPAASSFSLAASRLGWAVQDCALLSVHGRPPETVLPLLQPHRRVLALSWDETTPALLAQLLTRHGFGDAAIIVLEAIGGKRERVRRARADAFDLDGIDALNLVAIEIGDARRARVIPLAPGLPDGWFEHDGQLTKRDVRALALAALAPRRGELLWDIGAGSGSVGIEWMLTSPSNRAIAIERGAKRAERIARNASSLGVPGLRVVEGVAPAALDGLPPPDAVFIGGGATVPGVIDAAWTALRGGGRIVAHGVTIETQAELTARFRSLGGQLKTIQIAHAGNLGGLHGMRPAMAVTQWVGEKP
jgi:precorrin-6B C5,15-methyltransferase / cobalt-precorrin-6B C5,C15-methyltransferase